MFGLFSIKWIKILVIVSVLSTIGGVVWGGYTYVIHLQSEISRVIVDNATLTANSLNLSQAITEQADTIAGLQNDVILQTQIVQDTNSSFGRAREQVTLLRKRLSKHELGYLAVSRPALVTTIINKATGNVGRCLEIVSGSPLTMAERNAILPSNINTECPHVANPNYKDNE
jgi:hypothetical protein